MGRDKRWCPHCRMNHSPGVEHPHPIVRAEMANISRLMQLEGRPILCPVPDCGGRWFWKWNEDAGYCTMGHNINGLVLHKLDWKVKVP